MRPGYTLTELLVVVLILGSIAAVGVPAYVDRAAPNPAYRAASRIAGIIHGASRQAIIDGVEVGLLIDPDRGRFFVTRLDANGFVASDADTLGLPLGVSLIPEGIIHRLVFYPSGAARGRTIHVQHDTTHLFISVSAYGVARVQ